MTHKVKHSPICCGLMSIAGFTWLLVANTASGQTAEAFYASDVDSIVQAKCIACHRSGGQASYTELRYTKSVADNHSVLERYVNSPTKGARANTVLSKIRGALGHGGGQVISQGSADYQTFSTYVDLLSADEQPVDPGVLKVALEEPVKGQVHTGVGRARAPREDVCPSDNGQQEFARQSAERCPRRDVRSSISPSSFRLPCGASYPRNTSGEHPPRSMPQQCPQRNYLIDWPYSLSFLCLTDTACQAKW